MQQPPLIDTRNINDLIKRMKDMAPYYVPEWRFTPEDPDPGTALFMIFADMFQENIKRLNKVPLKNYMAFLNMLNVSVFPARAASAYVVFCLSSGADEPVYIPAGTQVSASGQDGGPIIFETEKNMLVTPAELVDIYNVSGRFDKIYRIGGDFLTRKDDEERKPITVYDFSGPDNLQEHSLYLSHAGMLNIKSTARVELEVTNALKRYAEPSICSKLASNLFAEWSYRDQDDWRLFDEVAAENNIIVLKKSTPGSIETMDLNEMAGKWIRCRLKEKKVNDLEGLEISSLAMGVDYLDCDGSGGVAPDSVFYNDIPRDLTGFYPLGEYFTLQDSFYLASQEVFSKKGARVNIRFNLSFIGNLMKNEGPQVKDFKDIMRSRDFIEPVPADVSVLTVSWEYWSGAGWAKLLSGKEYEEIFYHSEDREVEISFECPMDMEETYVNEQQNYWIRARVLNIENAFQIPAMYWSPRVENLRLTYSMEDRKFPPDACITKNNMEFLDRTEEIKKGGDLFRPFYSFDINLPAFYLGFARPPLKGPVSMFFSIKQQKYYGENPIIEWEYLRKNGSRLEWGLLKVQDETNGLTRSGTVVFAGPRDFARGSMFSRDLYWVRLVNIDRRLEHGNRVPKPVLNGIYMNCTRVVQHQSISGEMFETKAGVDESVYNLSMCPVISEEVFVNETGHYNPEIPETGAGGDTETVETVSDVLGNVQEVWTRWTPVDDFSHSSAEDRHYMINRLTGTISFGDGIHGKIPPVLGRENVRVNYKIGGGAKGNVGPFEINNLQNSIVFIDRVYNPDPAVGGCDTETLDKVLLRGPQILKNRNRAVTAEDYEWLVRESSQDIARVKCLPNRNIRGEKETGCLSVVVVPVGAGPGYAFFPELKQRVEKYLVERSASILSFPNKIQVIEPAYLEIAVHADLVADETDIIAVVEREATEVLNNFLNPLTGNFDGKGWEIGQYPHISVFYALLKTVSGVNFVQNISISVEMIEDGQRNEINPDLLSGLPHGMVVNGRHAVEVTVL